MKRPRAEQLGLFGEGASREAPDVATAVSPEDVRLSRALPHWLRFGTCSWTFPGWAGIVWEAAPSMAALTRTGLAAYARHPLFGTVSIDRSFYAPLDDHDLTAYAAQLPDGFPCLSKVWEELTTAVFPRHARYGRHAGEANPHFLSADRFQELVLAPYTRAFRDHTGPFVLSLTPQPPGALDPRAFTARLEAFLDRAPSGTRFAVEVRNRELLTKRYFEVLRAHDAAHALSFWSGMPSLGAQLRIPGVLTTDFVVARLMIAPGRRYAEERDRFAPFDRVVEPQHEMRDDVLELLRRAATIGQRAFVLVNNKAEGSAPGTIRALAARVADEPFAAR